MFEFMQGIHMVQLYIASVTQSLVPTDLFRSFGTLGFRSETPGGLRGAVCSTEDCRSGRSTALGLKPWQQLCTELQQECSVYDENGCNSMPGRSTKSVVQDNHSLWECRVCLAIRHPRELTSSHVM